jgi:zinc transport system ATP-binding protein
MPVASAIIEVQNLSFRFGGHTILENVNFVVTPGSYVGIIGPNGGGKTTLLKLLLGLLKPQEGMVNVFGLPPQLARSRGRIGYVPQRVIQSDASCPATVEEVVRSGRTPCIGFTSRYNTCDNCAVEEALRDTGVESLRHRSIAELSGGERQRVFISRALAAQPRLLLLDEPTTGVDSQATEGFYDLLQHLNQTHDMTIIIVSHDVEAVAKDVQSVLCVNRRLIAHCGPQDALSEPNMRSLYGQRRLPMHHHHDHA